MMRLLTIILMPAFSFCQHIDTSIFTLHKKSINNFQPARFLKPASSEICSNNIDDNKNGLVDSKDFACYFSSADTICMPTKVVWFSTNYGLAWVDLETGAERMVGSMPQMNDIAWASNGKLYGIDDIYGHLWEIDPNTAQTTEIGNVSGYAFGNAMTADGVGNLYIAMTIPYTSQFDIIKINISTQAVSRVTHLPDYHLSSAGDLTFLDGYLYLTCVNNKIAKINVVTGVVQAFDIINPARDRNLGLITLGDGYLYFTFVNQLYKVDPSNMKASLFYTLTSPNIYILGASTYSDQCNAPGCRARVYISTASNGPYCSTRGVVLKAKGTGIVGDHDYKWTIPGGGSSIGDSVLAVTSGKYFVRYHTLPDTCGQIDSISIDIVSSPKFSFGNDTTLCNGSTLYLQLLNTQNNTSYLWQDGTTSTFYNVTQPGKYSVEASNVCETFKDSITIRQLEMPLAFIGNDTSVCSGTSVPLKNVFNTFSENTNIWSNSSTSDSITAINKGIYWLEVKNGCGTVRDSILVNHKDSCICFPFFPKVQLRHDLELCGYDIVTLKNTQHLPGYKYAWQDGSENETFIVRKPGTYWVDVTTYCQTVRDSVVVTDKKDGCEQTMYVPSAFSPNNDSKNDWFHPTVFGKLKEYLFAIYNQWGEKVFETNEVTIGWDGKYKGVNQDTNAFAWVCRYQFEGGAKKNDRGVVLIIK